MNIFVANSKGKENEVYRNTGEQIVKFIEDGKHNYLFEGERGIIDRILRLEMADIIFVMPGTVKILNDLYIAIEAKRLGEYQGKILIVNINGYFDEALIMIEKSIDEGFTEESIQELYDIVYTPEELSEYFENLQAK